MQQNNQPFQARQAIEGMMQEIYRYALRRTACLQDAEDVAQEICLRSYRGLLARQDIASPEAFIRAVAHNTLVNYYRGRKPAVIGLGEDMDRFVGAEDSSPEAGLIRDDTLDELHFHIAALSDLQRKVVVLYYYEGLRQKEIAQRLQMPVGTVKWHLNRARNELKKGMEDMKDMHNLSFDPVRFSMMGFSGALGTMGGIQNFFRSALSQNIAYCTWRQPMGPQEIAQALGVSPVYVKSEASFLVQYGFLTEKDGLYRANILIDEPTEASVRLHDEVYLKAAALVADGLYHDLAGSGLLESPDLMGPKEDQNFMLWSLVFYALAFSADVEERIHFDEAMTYRPDGGRNIAYAAVECDGVTPPLYWAEMQRYCGPCWNREGASTLWVIDTPWSGIRIDLDSYQMTAPQDIRLLERFAGGERLSSLEYAQLVQRGYLVRSGQGFDWAIVHLRGAEIERALVEAGRAARRQHSEALDKLRDRYCRAMLERTPSHLKTAQAFTLQYIFGSDGWFLLHAAMRLVQQGLLTPPQGGAAQSMTTIFLSGQR